ncbi:MULTISPECIES: methyltransferase domain-containing protein [Microbacteriaceae]|uniref:Class I SAM-dependent methyltransferase n=1 Tax=Mycetocola reblochoni TaxID=331618 RepID=A0A3L6ZI90_9MICO|nr:class I SAM-dependent methyltransferase [Mycetocola reblochoni]RLP67766.1 class I SAM-dependent methyltransferase [Mycetocola reblochoni]
MTDDSDESPPADETVYEQLAEFHDLFMDDTWERLRPTVRSVFGALGAGGVIVELGAGSGVGTRVIAAESRARVWAVEPGLVGRAVLLARVSDDPSLRDRVTVVAGAIPEGLSMLPGGIDGVVCAHMLGHVIRDDRRELFGWLGEHLTASGGCLVTTQERVDPAPDAPRDVTVRRRVGQYEYRAVYVAADAEGVFRSRYEVWSGGVRLRAETSVGRWERLSADDIAEELRGTVLRLDVLDSGVAVIRRAGPETE